MLKHSHINDFTRGGGAKHLAFTLAEVIITLGVIGIVAALTIPNITTKFREKEVVSKLKKVYTTLSQALQQEIAEQGQTVDQWPLEYGDSNKGSAFLLEHYFKKYFIILNDCKKPNTCIGSKKYKYLNGIEHIAYNEQNSYRHIILSDGTQIVFHISPRFNQCSYTYNECANIFIDINGYFKGPNQFGKDFFVLDIKKDRLAPHGESKYCQNNRGSGDGCAAWVLEYENMDYLH